MPELLVQILRNNHAQLTEECVMSWILHVLYSITCFCVLSLEVYKRNSKTVIVTSANANDIVAKRQALISFSAILRSIFNLLNFVSTAVMSFQKVGNLFVCLSFSKFFYIFPFLITLHFSRHYFYVVVTLLRRVTVAGTWSRTLRRTSTFGYD